VWRLRRLWALWRLRLVLALWGLRSLRGVRRMCTSLVGCRAAAASICLSAAAGQAAIAAASAAAQRRRSCADAVYQFGAPSECRDSHAGPTARDAGTAGDRTSAAAFASGGRAPAAASASCGRAGDDPGLIGALSGGAIRLMACGSTARFDKAGCVRETSCSPLSLTCG
jgi:hypothetical protein